MARNFNRPTKPLREQKRRIIIVPEGKKTEPYYFRYFSEKADCPYTIVCVKGAGGSLADVLQKMKDKLKEDGKGFSQGDQAWIVADHDYREADDFIPLKEWASKKANYNLGISVHSFEYWLLLHFEDAQGVKTETSLKEHLSKHGITITRKTGIPRGRLDDEMIQQAVERARRIDKTRSTNEIPNWPSSGYCTTVYRLVETLLQNV